MKILFITRMVDFIDPIGPMILSALLKQAGHEARLCTVSRENIFLMMREYQPDLVMFSATTGEHGFYYQLNGFLKRHFSFFSVMGGPHATFSPEDQPDSGMDAFCRGEGEGFIIDLVSCLASGREIGKLQNIVYKGISSPIRPLLESLDTLPFPDRELFYSKTEMRDFPIKSFLAGRGCPFPCTYCFNHQWKKLYQGCGSIIRRRSVSNVIDEIDDVRKRYPLRFVKFYDDIFALRADDWLTEFAAEYRKRINLPFQCYTRADFVNEELVVLLKEAGCASVSMSIETGSYDIRKRLLKREMTDDQLLMAFHLFKKHGIHTFANTMLALPETGFEDDLRSVQMNIDCKADLGLFAIFHPYPKTELGDYCARMGYFKPDFTDYNTYYVTDSPLSCFSKSRKRKQILLSLWGTVAVAFPRFSSLILSVSHRIPSRSLAFALYYIAKAWQVVTKIYPARFQFWEGLKTFWKGWRLERTMRGVEDLKVLERQYMNSLGKDGS